MGANDLDERLLSAHSVGDTLALVDLYSEAADVAESSGDIDRACFYLTHAFVYGLELGHPLTSELNRRLVAHGRA